MEAPPGQQPRTQAVLVRPPSTRQRLAAAAVHVYTATGSVLALLMVHYSYRGEVETVLWLFLAAMVIDGTDGMLARRMHVKTVLPGFDGALLDNIVDYMTYTLAPMALLWSNGYLPDGVLGGILATAPLLASCYQFCRSDAKTDDHFFLGFPSYWNILAFYVIATGLGTATTALIIVACVVLVFVPIKYVYPSRTEPMWQLTFVLTALWFAAYAAIVAGFPDPNGLIVAASVGYLVYYTALSLWLTWQSPRRAGVA
jgi:phosphatidylcholine synthase